MTAEGSIRSPDEPRRFGPPFVPSVARGVGRSWCSTWSASVGPCPPAFRFSGSCEPPLVASCAVGVFSSAPMTGPRSAPRFPSIDERDGDIPARFVTSGVGSRPGDDEDPFPAVGSASVCRGYSRPFRVIPEVGQVSENGTACPQSMFVSGLSQTPRAEFQVAIGSGTEQSPHVFQHDQRWPQRVDGEGHVSPYTGPVALTQPSPAAGTGHVLARKAGRQDVHGPGGGPVGRGDVTVVGYVGVVVGEDLRRARVIVSDKGELAAEHRLDGAIEAPVARAKRGDPQAVHAAPASLLMAVSSRPTCPFSSEIGRHTP